MIPESTPILMFGSGAPFTWGIIVLKTPVNTRKPTRPANAAEPSPPLIPIAIPIAKIIGRLLKIAFPAAAIQEIFNKSGWPKRRSSAAAGNTAIGSIRERPRLCEAPSIRSPILGVLGVETVGLDEGLARLIA